MTLPIPTHVRATGDEGVSANGVKVPLRRRDSALNVPLRRRTYGASGVLPRLRRVPRRPALLAAVAAALVAALTSGCSGSEDEEPAPAVHTASNGDVFNDADAEFAAALLQHHAVALHLVDLSRGRGVSDELPAIADQILTTETVEIETVTDWLTAWDQTVPGTIRDHANAHAAERGEEIGVPGGDLPGMPSHDDLEELDGLDGPEFDRAWLELMIAHHEGAIELAEAEIDEGRFEPAIELARSVAEAQQDQVEQMETLAD